MVVEGVSLEVVWMRCRSQRVEGLVFVLFCLLAPGLSSGADEQNLSKEQIEHFLLTAKITNIRHSSKGITDTLRLTLSDGTVTHDASFQAIDEHKTEMTLSDGRRELLFVDSYKYNIAAYRLAELLGLDEMLPVYVERKWQAQTGSLSWWVPVQMDEAERLKRKISPPDDDAWNKQMYKIRVLDELVYDTDPNLTNVLISPDWKIYRIDFTRAFRLAKNLRAPKDLVRCDRTLFDKLKALDQNELSRRTKGYLNKDEVEAVMGRRDKIVTYFQKLIAQNGENEVLY
jgi:hypothetical protein